MDKIDKISDFSLLNYQANKAIYGDNLLDITIIPTTTCNFKCHYCYEKKEPHFMNDSTFQSILKFLKRTIRKYEMVNIDWFGGEPLLAIDKINSFMQEIVPICRKEKILLISNMTTNGYFLDSSNMNKLVNNMILYYQITLDGTEETHNKLRYLSNGQGSYKQIIDNLCDIKDNVLSKRIRILIRINVTKEVYDNFDEFLIILQALFGNDPRFLFLAVPVQNWGGQDINNIKASLITFEQTQKLNEKLQSIGLLKPSLYHNFSKGVICSASRSNGFIINYDGTLHKCTQAMESSEEDIKNLNCVGKINVNGYMELDEQKEAFWVTHSTPDSERCNNCKIYSKCYGTGCRYSILKNGNTACRWKEESNYWL